MSEVPPVVLVRHGETDWSASRQHTGRTDIPLNAAGIFAACTLAARLPAGPFLRVWTSPSSRARETARLAGFADAAVVPDLAEWDYGDFEGLTTAEIQSRYPEWNLFRDGCPNGENATDVGARAQRVIAELTGHRQATLIFSSAHFLRVLGAQWAGWPPQAGNGLAFEPAGIAILGTEHDGTDRVLRAWNITA
jgi:probable phosphoglycerate mutase